MRKVPAVPGQMFGQLVFLEERPSRIGVKQKKTRWLVQCPCGTSFDVDRADVVRTDRKARASCGCMNYARGRQSPFWKSPNGIPSVYWSRLRAGAVSRGYAFDLTIEEAWTLFLRQDSRCALTGRVIELGSSASLDRIDSRLGYAVDNVQWLHKDINQLKSNLSEAKFTALCMEVADYARRP